MKQGEQIAALSAQFHAHAAEDTRRFTEVNGKLDEIAVDVKSLLTSRSFNRGFWKAVLLIGGGAGGTVAAIIAIVRSVFTWN